jgi:hypothetical protein
VRFFKKAPDRRLVFRFDRPEREMFTRVLEMFPMQKGALRPIGGDEEGAQEILENALAEQRRKLREEADRLLTTNGALVIDANFNEFWDLTLDESQIEWLLQMLNDVRVGLWVKLDCPNPAFDPEILEKPDEEMLRSNVIMHLCAAWQSVLMAAGDSQSGG